MNYRVGTSSRSGFTIVELLIVVVVIAILAAITIVSFNGISAQANDAAVKSDLKNFGTAMQMYRSEQGEYPLNLSSVSGLKFTKNLYGTDNQGYNLRYCRNADTDRYAFLVNLKDGRYFKVTESGVISSNSATSGYGVCNLVGVSSTNPATANNGYRDTTGWASWVND